MADQNDQTSSDDADQTSSDQDEATDTNADNTDEATDTITIKKDDYNQLVSDRDKNFNNADNAENEVEDLRAEIARDKEISKFLRDNKDDYPDVLDEDLTDATSNAEIEAIAKTTQERFNKIEQRALEKLQNVPSPPPLTAEDKEQKVAALKERSLKGEDTFEEMLEILNQ